MDYDGSLVVESWRKIVDSGFIFVGREGILILHDGVGMVEELSWRGGTRVEDDGGRDRRGNVGVYIVGCLLVIIVHVIRGGVAGFIEEDAGHRDISRVVCRPLGIEVYLGGECGVGNLGVAGCNVAKGKHVGEAIKFGEGGDVVGIWWR